MVRVSWMCTYLQTYQIYQIHEALCVSLMSQKWVKKNDTILPYFKKKIVLCFENQPKFPRSETEH